jgi:sugar lactone lactonase YvrE
MAAESVAIFFGAQLHFEVTLVLVTPLHPQKLGYDCGTMSSKKLGLFPVWLCAVACLLLLSTGCVISPRRTFGGSATPTPTPTPITSPTATPTPTPAVPTGKLYVSNSISNSIVRFDNAFTVTGNATPAATITGAATTLNTPAFITLDVVNDRLYVANNGDVSILIFDNISTKNGNIAPERTISGIATNLVDPTDVSVDTTKDLLYVADETDVYVFATASTATGNVAPIHDIQVNFTVSAVLIDAASDTLYIADTANSAIHVYNGASTLDGPVTANRTLQGATTHLANPGSLQIDGAGRLVVSNSPTNTTLSSITIYPNAATITGNIAPSGEIKGSSTGLIVPDQLVVDKTGTSTIYNADSGAGRVAIFANTGTANGNIAPTRAISGANTGLSVAGRPQGVAFDATR